jgi:hypothetical protein
MVRFLVGVCAVVLAACGGLSGSGTPAVQGPPSAQKVAANSSDFGGMQICPESGTWDSYLKAEQNKDPTQFQTDKTTWDDLKAAGANDSYIVAYAQSTSDCGQFASGTPSGKVAYVYAVRFKDSTAASTNFKGLSKDFHLSDSEVGQLKAAGATVSQGASTGLGDNAVLVSIDIQGTSVFVAFWQKKQFEVAVVSFNIPTAATATTNINARIS